MGSSCIGAAPMRVPCTSALNPTRDTTVASPPTTRKRATSPRRRRTAALRAGSDTVGHELGPLPAPTSTDGPHHRDGTGPEGAEDQQMSTHGLGRHERGDGPLRPDDPAPYLTAGGAAGAAPRRQVLAVVAQQVVARGADPGLGVADRLVGAQPLVVGADQDLVV